MHGNRATWGTVKSQLPSLAHKRLCLRSLLFEFNMLRFSSTGKYFKTSTSNKNARALGDANLFQSYFVCVTESDSSTLIEYGKTLGTSESGDIYLNMLDASDRLNVRFYVFGNGDKKLDVIDAHIVSRDMTEAECKGDTHMDLETRLCTQKCHEDCDPLHGNQNNNNNNNNNKNSAIVSCI